VVSVLKEVVEPTDPRNNLCEVGILGTGSSSTVLQVYQTSLRRTMALKRMIIKKQQRPELLINELTVMKRCLHPNIIEFHGSYLVEEEVWILMECCRGSLTDHLIKNRLIEESIATISKQCLSALSYLHSIGIIHRDIKSDSVLFTNNWTVKLTDFGFSTILTDQFPKRRSLLGTSYWLAPEVNLPFNQAEIIQVGAL
jgi:serine/threonine protein kinase